MQITIGRINRQRNLLIAETSSNALVEMYGIALIYSLTFDSDNKFEESTLRCAPTAYRLLEHHKPTMQPSRIIWKIVVGAILVLVTASNVPMYLNGSAQANGALAMSVLMICGGFYLIYRGLYPSGK